MIKERVYIKRALALVLSVILMIAVMLPRQVDAAVTGQEKEVTLLDTRVGRYQFSYTGNTNHYVRYSPTRVGRYQFSYTGNTNHYVRYSPSGNPMGKRIYNDLGGGYENSSVATLSRSTSTSRIKYAYLVWQTRAKEAPTSPVVLVTPDGKRGNIYPDYAINDWRVVGDNPGMQSLFCMAKDVTGIVRSSGYGNYAVCNIPFFNYGDGGDTGGGESPGSWQLIVVEEDDSFPVRAVTMSLCSLQHPVF